MVARRETVRFVKLTVLFLRFSALVMGSSGLVLHPHLLFHSSFKQGQDSKKEFLFNMDFKSCVSGFNVSNAFDVMTYARHSNLCKMYENRKSSDSSSTCVKVQRSLQISL